MCGLMSEPVDALPSPSAPWWRRGARLFATALLAVVALAMLDNAATVRERAVATNLNETAAVPGVEVASSLSAGLCAVVLCGVGWRLFSRHKPRLRWLWLAG